jgi:hypothetical protein
VQACWKVRWSSATWASKRCPERPRSTDPRASVRLSGGVKLRPPAHGGHQRDRRPAPSRWPGSRHGGSMKLARARPRRDGTRSRLRDGSSAGYASALRNVVLNGPAEVTPHASTYRSRAAGRGAVDGPDRRVSARPGRRVRADRCCRRPCCERWACPTRCSPRRCVSASAPC